jgi:SAM-dependent methyltransferase
MYQEYTYQSPFFVKRWLHQKRYRDSLRVLGLTRSDTLLDYGCGDAYFLRMCARVVPAGNLCGYEPDRGMFNEAAATVQGTGITVVNTLEALSGTVFTRVTCLETAEHMVGGELTVLLTNLHRFVAQGGRILVSVPIETGLPALCKNTFRILIGHMPDNLTAANFVKMVAGVPTQRSTPAVRAHGQYIYSHMGFNHQQFEQQLKEHLSIEDKHYSPVDFLGSGLNNIAFYTCARK